jgi:cation:H+ antiporter
VSTGVALIVFAVGLAVSLGASEFLVRGFGRLGTNVGLAAGLVGLLTALGADAPEISSAVTALLSGAKDVGLGVILGSNLFNLAALLGLSAIVAGQVSFRRILLALDGGVALFATLVVGAMLLLGLAPIIALVLVLAVFLFYVYLLAAEPHRVDHLLLPPHMRHRLAAAARLIHGDLERSQGVQDSWAPVWWIVPSIAAIVAGSVAMVNGALVLGDHWHLSRIFLGAVALAAITSLPNAYAATRLALSGNGTAVVSLAFNSNTLNLLAGVSVPAVLIGGMASAPGALSEFVWLMVLTLIAIERGYRERRLSRRSGAVLILGYLVFVVVIILH